MRRKIIIISLLVILAALTAAYFIFSGTSLPSMAKKPVNEGPKGLASFGFEEPDALKKWEEKVFKGRVIYSVNKTKNNSYLNAYSKSAASGIVHWLKFNPKEKPMVRWKWKVTRFPVKSSASSSGNGWLEKEDYAARFYIIFPKFPFFRLQCLEYIWSEDLPLNTVITNQSFGNLKLIVVESGTKNLSQWVSVERNIYEDFKRAFGRAPSEAGAIAIMTNANNSDSTAEAQYDEIEVGYAK